MISQHMHNLFIVDVCIFSLYVTRVGTVGKNFKSVQTIIGTGQHSNSLEGTLYLDERLNDAIEFYIIIRLFSDINNTVS